MTWSGKNAIVSANLCVSDIYAQSGETLLSRLHSSGPNFEWIYPKNYTKKPHIQSSSIPPVALTLRKKIPATVLFVSTWPFLPVIIRLRRYSKNSSNVSPMSTHSLYWGCLGSRKSLGLPGCPLRIWKYNGNLVGRTIPNYIFHLLISPTSEGLRSTIPWFLRIFNYLGNRWLDWNSSRWQLISVCLYSFSVPTLSNFALFKALSLRLGTTVISSAPNPHETWIIYHGLFNQIQLAVPYIISFDSLHFVISPGMVQRSKVRKMSKWVLCAR